MNWLKKFKYNPIESLQNFNLREINYFIEKDLLDRPKKEDELWNLPEVTKLINKQEPEGFWKYPGGDEKSRSIEDYNQIETYRNSGILIEKYGLNKNHEAISDAAEYLFSCQTDTGDFRGIYGNQYTPNYSAGIMELLIKAGYEKDSRIKKGFEWLLSIRQNDGGWAIPLRTRQRKLDIAVMKEKVIEPDTGKPFSHMVTGVVLRSFAAHTEYRHMSEAKTAGKLLLSRLFKKDNYPERGTPEYWLKFTFPFWFTDLLSAMDTLSFMGFSSEEPRIKEALDWFIENQQKDGLWQLKMLKKETTPYWLALSICRAMQRFYGYEKI